MVVSDTLAGTFFLFLVGFYLQGKETLSLPPSIEGKEGMRFCWGQCRSGQLSSVASACVHMPVCV